MDAKIIQLPTPETSAGPWLRRRDAWMRQLTGSAHISDFGKLVGLYLALRLSAKRPFTYPAVATIGKALDKSPRQVARALKELEAENYLLVRRNKGRVSQYRLDM